MPTRYANPSATARALFEALWPEPMRRLMVLDIPGGIAVISAAFDVIVDVGAANIPTLPKVIDHMRATGRDLMLVNLALDNSEGMVALCRFAKPDAPASQIVAVSGLSFHLDSRNQLALVHDSGLDYAQLIERAPRIAVTQSTLPMASCLNGIERATLIARAVKEALTTQATIQ